MDPEEVLSDLIDAKILAADGTKLHNNAERLLERDQTEAASNQSGDLQIAPAQKRIFSIWEDTTDVLYPAYRIVDEKRRHFSG